jgi:hypothetical protein
MIWFNLIFSDEIIQYSRTFALQVQTPWNQAHAPLVVESFPKTPRTQSEASQFGGSYKYKQNKTNKLPSFIEKKLNNNNNILYIHLFYKKLKFRESTWD